VLSPSWSPDGHRVVFSALKGGLSDLYVIDLEDGAVTALTADSFADIQPAWSPDGRSIAFATDRFSSSLETLSFGNLRLGVVDVASGRIQELPSLDNAKNINPQWSADGASLYFIADAGGISDVYRLDIARSDVFQITRVATGVSGVTALSPALSVAAGADRLAFTVFRHGGYEIQTLGIPQDQSTARRATLPAPAVPGETPASPAPVWGPVTAAPIFGVPDGNGFTVKPYHAGLSLNRMIQPYFSAGGGSAGGFVRAGVGLSFGDMLGDHQLQTALQVGKSIDDFIAHAAYLNRRSRWNWGIAGGQVPWILGVSQSDITRPADGRVFRRQTDLFRQVHRQVSMVGVYPFSRSQRLELTSGVQTINFDRQSTISEYSASTGRMVSEASTTGSASPSARLVESGAALVYDSSVFGPTSPILGTRYRFAVAPTFGSLTFTTVTADYRRYVMPVRPLTVAVRFMHLGRYGAGASDPRLLPLAWTLRDVVRGYGDTGSNAGNGSYLSATQMSAANLEFRVPLSRAFGTSGVSNVLPLEGLVFADVGRFSSSSIWSSTGTLRSVGAGVRLNAAGFVFELDGVLPIDRRSHGWGFSFNFRPGF
jgi:hypothetical protein